MPTASPFDNQNPFDNRDDTDRNVDYGSELRNYLNANPDVVKEILSSRMEFAEAKAIDDPLLNKEKLKNTRRLAWTSLIAILVIMAVVFFYLPPDNIRIYENIISWVLTALSGVILGYMGVTSWTYNVYSKNNNNHQNQPPSNRNIDVGGKG